MYFISFIAYALHWIYSAHALCLRPRSIIATSSWDTTIKIWDLDEGSQCIMTLKGHTQAVNEIIFSSNFNNIISTSEDSTLKVWDVANGVCIKTLLGHSSFVLTIDISPDGQLIASGDSEKNIKIWKTTDYSLAKDITSGDSIQKIRFSPDGKLLICSVGIGIIEIFEISSWIKIKMISPHTSIINSLTFAAKKNYLITTSSDKLIKIIDLSNQYQVVGNLFGHENWVVDSDINSSEDLLVTSGADFKIKTWNLTAGSLINTFEGHSSSVLAIKLSYDGKYLVSGSDEGVIKIWEVSTGLCLKTYAHHSFSIMSIKIANYCLKKQYSGIGEAYCDCGNQFNISSSILNTCKNFQIASCKDCLCTMGYFPQGKICQPCLEGCKVCKDNITCDTCNPLLFKLYTKVNNYEKCVNCNNSNEYLDEVYSYSDGTGVCLQHSDCEIPNCTKCSDLYGKCRECRDSFYLDVKANNSACLNCSQMSSYVEGTTCKLCPLNCDICKNQTYCEKCRDFFYLQMPPTNYQLECTRCDSTNTYIDEAYAAKDGSGICLKHSECTIPYCKKCSSKYKDCRVCMENFYLISNQSCGCERKGFFLNDNQCFACSKNCESCKNQTFCEKCEVNTYKLNSNTDPLTKICDSCNTTGSYVDEKYSLSDGNGICLIHSDCKIQKCNKCSNLFRQCSMCQDGHFTNTTDKNESCTTCLQPGYVIEGAACLACSENCESCQKISVCDKCKIGFYILSNFKNSSGNECTACNNQGMYIDEKNDSPDGYGLCLKNAGCVIKNCRKCINNYESCAVCEGIYYLNSSDFNKTCIPCNMSSYFIKGITCAPCPENCEQCQNEAKCEKCKIGFFQVPSINSSFNCENCTGTQGFNTANSVLGKELDNCKDCSIAIKNCKHCESDNSCIECNKGYYLKSSIEGQTKYDTCVLYCPRNFAEGILDGRNSPVCEACTFRKTHIMVPPLCEVCRKCESFIKGCGRCSTLNTCDECLTNYFFFNATCMPNCSLLNKTILTFPDLKCVEECEAGYFNSVDDDLSINICMKCPVECETCKGLQNCIFCSFGYFLEGNRCKLSCSEGKFPNWPGRSCSECRGDELVFFDNSGLRCIKCQPPCSGCFLKPTNCTSCLKGLYWNNTHCANSCGIGKYPIEEFGLCGRCHYTCLVCDKSGSNGCISCQDDLFFIMGSCVKDCPDNYFKSPASKSCEPCHITCSNCVGRSLYDCFECSKTRILKKNRISNVDELSLGECLCKPRFFEKGESECGECHYSCANCTGSGHLTCISCAANRGDDRQRPFQGRCTCPANTFDYLEEMCKDNSELSSTISLIFAQEQSVKYATISSIIGFGLLRVFGSLFNFIDVAQEINLYSFLNIAYPLNLESLLNFLSSFRFYKNFKFFEFEKNIQTNQTNLSQGRRVFYEKGISEFFLKNCVSTLIILFCTPAVFYVFSKILGFYYQRRERNFAHFSLWKRSFYLVWKSRRLILAKLVFILFLSCLQEMNIFVFLQIINFNKDGSLLDQVNVALSILWIIFEISIVIYLIKAYFNSNPGMLPGRQTIKQRAISRNRDRSFKFKQALPQNRDKYPFLFGTLLKENKDGMSYLFFKIIKKILLPAIYSLFSDDTESATTILLAIYFSFYLYLRFVQPYKFSIFNITNELTEIGHMNFFVALKFYIRAVSLKNSELALGLGLYMIYAVVVIIVINTFFMGLSFFYIFYKKLEEIKHSRRSTDLSTGKDKQADSVREQSIPKQEEPLPDDELKKKEQILDRNEPISGAHKCDQSIQLKKRPARTNKSPLVKKYEINRNNSRKHPLSNEMHVGLPELSEGNRNYLCKNDFTNKINIKTEGELREIHKNIGSGSGTGSYSQMDHGELLDYDFSEVYNNMTSNIKKISEKFQHDKSYKGTKFWTYKK